jgi:hypothetical protein
MICQSFCVIGHWSLVLEGVLALKVFNVLPLPPSPHPLISPIDCNQTWSLEGDRDSL